MMIFDSLIQTLMQLRNRKRSSYSLLHLKEIVRKLGPMPKKTHVMQVVGTNGKGSVSYKVASALFAAGHDVGLFTSPHMLDVRERILLNSNKLEKQQFIDHYERVSHYMQGFHTTFFDTLFLIAYSYFQASAPSVAIFEAGIGARLDATSLLEPDVSILTTIALDHREILGDSIESIAHEKKHVLRQSIPAVLGPKAQHAVVLDYAFSLGSPLYFISQKASIEEENQAVAQQAIFLTNLSYSSKALKCNPRFRYEKHTIEGVNCILDGAHNMEGFKALIQRLNGSSIFVVGFTSTYNQEQVVKLLRSLKCRFVVVSEASLGLIECIEGKHQKIEKGIKWALKEAKEKKYQLVVAGSFYLMEPALQSLQTFLPPHHHLDRPSNQHLEPVELHTSL